MVTHVCNISSTYTYASHRRAHANNLRHIKVSEGFEDNDMFDIHTCSSVLFLWKVSQKYIYLKFTLKKPLDVPLPLREAPLSSFKTDQGRITQLPSSLLEVKIDGSSVGLVMTTGWVTFSPFYPIMAVMSSRMADRKMDESFEGWWLILSRK